MPHLRHTSYDGYLESDEFIDLDRAFDQDGPSSPTSTTTRLCHYPPISFQSIDDEELRHFTRTLVTPRPHSNMPYTHRLSHQKGQVDLELASETGKLSLSQRMRSESVMLFHQIDNGDEDVSFDLVSSDLKDLIDYSLVPEMISRPASRTPFATQNYNRHSAPSDKETQPTYNAFAQSLKRAQHATHRPTEARNKDYTPQIPFQKSFSPERKTESIGRHKMAVETHTLSSSSTRTSENSHSPAQTQVTAPTQAPELPLLPLDYRPQESAHKMLPRTIRLDRTSSTRGRPSQSAATTQRERKISDNAITATRNRSRLNPKDKRYSMDVSLYASQYDKGTRLPPSSDALCENNLRPLRQAHTLAMSQQERRQRHGTGESGSVISTFALTEMLANHETCMLENEETPLDWDDTMTLRSYSRSDGPAQRPLSAHYPSLNSKSSVYSPKSIQRMVPDSIATRNRTLSTPEKYKLSLNTLASKQQILPRPRTVSLPQKERPKEETRATQTDSIEPLDTFQQAVERLRKDSNASRHGNTAYTNREMVSHSEPTSRMKEVLPTTPRLSDNHTTRSIMTARQTRNIEFKTQEAQTTAVDMDSSTWTLSSASQSGGSSIFEPSSPEGQPTSGDSSLSNSPSDAIVAVDTKTQAKAHSMDEHNKATERMKKETILSSLRHRPTRTDHRRQSASVPTAYTPVEKKRHSMVVDMREKEKSPIVGSRVTFGMDSPREMRAVKQRMVGSRTFHSDIKRDGQSFRETIRTYPTPVKSVTESAKEVLADIRQRRQGLSSQTKIHGETVLESKKSPKPNVLPQLSLRRKTVVGYETKQHSVTDTTHRTNSRESTPHLQKSKVKIQRTPTESISISGPGDYRYRTEPLDAVQRTRAVDRLSSRRHSSFIESKSSVEEGKYTTAKARRDYMSYTPKDNTIIRPVPSESRLPRRSSFLGDPSSSTTTITSTTSTNYRRHGNK